MMQRQTIFVFAALLLILMVAGAAGVFAQEPSGGTSTYTVERGDILDSIAAFYDVQTACLAESNDLGDGSEIRPGQVLLISFDCPRYDGLDFVTNPRESGGSGGGVSEALGQGGGEATVIQPGPDDTTYTVERGDTLDTIGQELNVSVVAIQRANDIGPRDRIMPGTTLVIPADAPAYGQFPPLVNPENPSVSDLGQGGGGPVAGPGDQLYVVQPLDVLDLIGAQFDAQIACIAETNGLSNPNVIYPGQTLVIPASCPRYDGEAFVLNPRGE